jgi:Flp pilus assembly protein TadG
MIRHTPRRGVVALEGAIVYPVFVLVLLLLVVGGVTVFRYQQVAMLSQEASRWVSVRGSDWAKATDSESPTESEIRAEVVLPLAAGMKPTDLTVKVEWVNGETGEAEEWDDSEKTPVTEHADGTRIANRVRVTVGYRWAPGLLFAGTVKLQSVAEIPMSY